MYEITGAKCMIIKQIAKLIGLFGLLLVHIVLLYKGINYIKPLIWTSLLIGFIVVYIWFVNSYINLIFGPKQKEEK